MFLSVISVCMKPSLFMNTDIRTMNLMIVQQALSPAGHPYSFKGLDIIQVDYFVYRHTVFPTPLVKDTVLSSITII